MLDKTFAALKALLVPYADRFTVLEDTDTTYSLHEELPFARTQFGVVAKRTRDVAFYFYPLHVFKLLKQSLPAGLASKVVHKSVLRMTTVTATDRKALAKVIADAWKLIAEHRRLYPTHAYCRPPKPAAQRRVKNA